MLHDFIVADKKEIAMAPRGKNRSNEKAYAFRRNGAEGGI